MIFIPRYQRIIFFSYYSFIFSLFTPGISNMSTLCLTLKNSLIQSALIQEDYFSQRGLSKLFILKCFLKIPVFYFVKITLTTPFVFAFIIKSVFIFCCYQHLYDQSSCFVVMSFLLTFFIFASDGNGMTSSVTLVTINYMIHVYSVNSLTEKQNKVF